MRAFELELVGGPWARRLAKRRAGFDELPWHAAGELADSDAALAAARWVWTQSAFSETASAAAFAEIATLLLAAGAPIDLVAACGDFVADEVLHAELSARMAAALGGAVALDVDLEKLVRPPTSATPLMRAAELVVRTSCVGEALTLPILRATKAASTSPLLRAVVGRIARDEAAHAELGGWFLDWADARLTDVDRAELGNVASAAVLAFKPLFAAPAGGSKAGACGGGEALGVLSCDRFDPAFADALARRVIAPLALRGVVVAV